MQVYIKCHYILRTLQGDSEDTELWGLVSVLREFTHTINSRRITESTHSGIHYTQRLWGLPESRGKETRDEYTCWDNLQEWGRSGEQWVGFTVGRCQGPGSWRPSKPLITGLSWRRGTVSVWRAHTTSLFLLPAGGKDAETSTFTSEGKYLSVQIITLQLIMQSKQYTWDLNIMTAWKFTVFELRMQHFLPTVGWKVAED